MATSRSFPQKEVSFDQYTKNTEFATTFPSISRYIYSKHRRLQILEKKEQLALGNTPVLQDLTQVHFQ